MALALCPDRQELSALISGEISAERSWELSRHVDACSHCQTELESLDAQRSWIEQGLNSEPPEIDSDCQAALERVRGLTAASDEVKTVSTVGVLGMLASLQPTLLRTEPPPQETLREYKLLSRIGAGGMGTVYKAEHTRLRRLVAIKLLSAERTQSPSAVARFDREMHAIGALDHPNIVRALDAGEHSGQHFLVMEYITGCDVAELVRRRGRLAIADACEIVRQAALGLQHAHMAGLVHRDIKPGNLMLTPEGTVKILDLGLALLSQQSERDDELTGSGQVMGTLDYMAPEQGDDMHGVDIRADIYSLGATLYKLLTGQTPFADVPRGSSMQKVVALATLMPKPVSERRPEIPAELSAVVMRMLAKSPEARPARPAEVVALLAPYSAGADVAQLALTAADTTVKPGTGDTDVSVRSASRDTAPTGARSSGDSVVAEFAKSPNDAAPNFGEFRYSRSSAIVAAIALFLLLLSIAYWYNAWRLPPAPAIAPFDAEQAGKHQQAWAAHLGLPVEYRNSLGMRFRLIPPGEYVMGSPPEEITEALTAAREPLCQECIRSGAPQHRVRITQPFYLSAHEVTQRDYEAVQRANPAYFKQKPDHPIETVRWGDAIEFCVKLSEQEKLKPHYVHEGRRWELQADGGYRLPTEAEWEFACRAGTTTKFSTGDSDERLLEAAWFGPNGNGRTHAVGTRQANPFGLFDMHGNVWEWCQDEWDPSYYDQFADSIAVDSPGPQTQAMVHRVTRGGCWMWGAGRCRSSYRDHSDPLGAMHVIGFRVVLPVEAVRVAK
jgi:serine/threonine protein kinase/formylglycine-generating enzyme required for sulfatase activity